MRYRAVVGEGVSTPSGTLLLWPGKNLRTGESDFSKIFGDISSLERDLLRVASAIFACDLAFKRGQREEIVRTIELSIPVVNHKTFISIKNEIEIALWNLSDDNWSLEFKRIGGVAEPARKWPGKNGKTILFSGGVDSFSGAVELIEQNGAKGVHLASHFTGNVVIHQSQTDLYEHLKATVGQPQWTAIRTGGKKSPAAGFPADHEREDSQRTRSFMFLTIAALAARRSGHRQLVYIAENGQMAIHLPLSPARIGAFSTHTAHPEFVRRMAHLLSEALEIEILVENPYLYLTKAEVVARITQAHRGALCKAVSCWRASRVTRSRHCGECVPCLIRRISFEKNDIATDTYARDLFSENITGLPETDEGKRNLVELVEFAQAFATKPDAALEEMFPDLINEEIKISDAIAMYKRFAGEALDVIARYKGPAALRKKNKGRRGVI
jgi:Queuosine biosynthesis protein QueC